MGKRDPWQEACGAIIYHAIQMQKGIDTQDRFRRLKNRVIELEILLDQTAKEKKAIMTVMSAVKSVYSRLPIGTFSGTKLTERVRFLTGRPHMHNDSALRALRKLREIGEIDFINTDSKKKSLYIKRRTDNV